VRGVLAVLGVIGTWAGPRSPGTAYVMAHHKIGDVGDGQTRPLGLPRGRHGRRDRARCARRRALRRRRSAPTRRSPASRHDGRVRGVVLGGGDELDAEW
jgi:hypothetical protein